jgi:hypothetical protein
MQPSAQLGYAQLGYAQLGSGLAPLTPASAPPSVLPTRFFDTSNLNTVVLPDYFKMMGICAY